ncbi:MAG: phytanoyl-CoA dioxygenase family protein, partial [Rhodosalinus sp.]
EQQVHQFNRNGFLNAGEVLDEGLVDRLSDALDAVIARGPDGFANGEPRPVLFRDLTGGDGEQKTPVWQIVNIWEAAEPFRELIHEPAIVEAIAQLTGFEDLQVWHDQVQYKPAEAGGATSWHQDAPLWPTIEPQTPVSAWIPFDDATEENGCMWMVPGSHRWGDVQKYLATQNQLRTLAEFPGVGQGFEPPAHAPITEIEAVPCPVKRGEVHFHHSLTWHGSPQNRSTRPRRAMPRRARR